MEELFDSQSVIPVSDLISERAKDFARYVLSGSNPAFALTECRLIHGHDVVVVSARARVPQRPKNDIRYEEPLAVLFGTAADELPQVLSLRRDFPQVPHLNLSRSQFPKSLCLFAERREDLNLRWTPALLGERILWWLRETAYGTLHREDQSLEPFIGGVNRPLILPPDIFSSSDSEMLLVYRAGAGTKEVLIADRPENIAPSRPGQPFTLFPFELPIQEHGIIHTEPITLRDLDLLCQQVGYDLVANLRKRLQEKAGRLASNSIGTILVVGIPKVRQAGKAVESTDVFGFRCQVNMNGKMDDVSPTGLGVVLQVLGQQQSVIAGVTKRPFQMLLTSIDQVRKQASKVSVPLLFPEFKLTLKQASALSGHPARTEKSILAVGVGALGSQVFENLARQGFGQWTLVDNDYFAPHNVVRHAIFGSRFGLAKAVEMANQANQIFGDEPIAKAIVADVLSPQEHAQALEERANAAQFILDMSASVPVSRHLALNWNATAKRASLFLSPSGSDLVVMAEDEARTVPLDAIELQYLRALLEDPRLEGHLHDSQGRSRYSGSCRDITSHISQEPVALHAAIGAKAVRDIAQTSEAHLNIWRCHTQEMTVTKVEITLAAPIACSAGDWTIVFDESLKKTLLQYRSKWLPRETCGALLGYLDTQRKRIYVCQALPAPVDSVQEPSGCERGVEGMGEAVKHAGEVTMNQVTYIGEWHSHPDGVACRESEQDKKQMEWLKKRLHPEGRPALILIACQQNEIWPYLSSP